MINIHILFLFPCHSVINLFTLFIHSSIQHHQKSSKKGKTTSKKQTSNKSKENVGEKNEYENEGESPDKNDQSKESINNEEKSPIKEVTDDTKDNVNNPDDEQLAEAYEAALNLDKEAKECVDRGQQTSRPESEAVRAALRDDLNELT